MSLQFLSPLTQEMTHLLCQLTTVVVLGTWSVLKYHFQVLVLVLVLKYWYLYLYLRHGYWHWYLRLNVIVMCRLSVRQFVWKYWMNYWFVCGGCRIQFDRLSIVKHCCISDCTLCYVLSLTSNFVRAYMTQQQDTDYKYWYSGTGTWNRSTGTGTWDSSTGTWMTEYWLQLCSWHQYPENTSLCLSYTMPQMFWNREDANLMLKNYYTSYRNSKWLS